MISIRADIFLNWLFDKLKQCLCNEGNVVLYREWYEKQCKDENPIDVDRRGFEIWKSMKEKVIPNRIISNLFGLFDVFVLLTCLMCLCLMFFRRRNDILFKLRRWI